MKTYYIYRIPRTNKIGCTYRLKKRLEQEQGVKEYEILYTTTDINDASDKEIEMQDKYKYKRDRTPYNKLNVNKMEKLHITQETITFKKVFEKKDFKEKYSYLKTINLPDFGEVKVTEDIRDFIEKKLKKSQFPNLPMYIYNETLWHYYKTSTATIFDNIRQWAKQKGILDKGDSKTQYIKLQEEAGELAQAILSQDKPEIQDAIGDMVVVLTSLAHLEGFTIEECIESAYGIISKRTGKMIEGTFVKNK